MRGSTHGTVDCYQIAVNTNLSTFADLDGFSSLRSTWLALVTLVYRAKAGRRLRRSGAIKTEPKRTNLEIWLRPSPGWIHSNPFAQILLPVHQTTLCVSATDANCTMSHNLPQICTKTKCIHQYQQREANTCEARLGRYKALHTLLGAVPFALGKMCFTLSIPCKSITAKIRAANDLTCHFASPTQ